MVQNNAPPSQNREEIVPKPTQDTRPHGHHKRRAGEPDFDEQQPLAGGNDGENATLDILPSRVDSSSAEAPRYRYIFAEVIVQDSRDVRAVAGPLKMLFPMT